MVAVMLNQIEFARLVLIFGQRDDLGQLVWLLGVVDGVAINDDDVSQRQVLMAIITMVVGDRWLVHGPVVEWWINHGILGIKLHIHSVSLVKVELIWTNSNLLQTKSSASHSVISHD